MKRCQFLSVLTLVGALVGFHSTPVQATTHGAFGEEERLAIEVIVRDYILSNPEIIVEALRGFEERQRLADVERAQRRITESRDDLQNDPSDPIGGNPDGDVTVVEFFDYQCPYCKVVAPRLTQLLQDDSDIRFVYKEWPILGPVSDIAARAALAARMQGDYVAFHDRLMTASGRLTEESIFRAAEELGFDIQQLRRDMAAPEIDEIIRRNRALADRLGISGTPAFVIGDVFVPGAIGLAELRALVEQSRRDG